MDHSYFLTIAVAVSTKSKDPSTKVGCVIVNSNNKIISTGYNGFVAGCDESYMTFERPLKYDLIIHGEQNAILYSSQRDMRECVVYSTQAPCVTCLKLILQSGIRRVYYKSSSVMVDRSSADQKDAIKRLILATGAEVRSEAGVEYLEELCEI